MNKKAQFFEAIRAEDLEKLRALLSSSFGGLLKGVDPNIVNEDGDTPIIVAAANGNRDIVETLCSAGADINYKSPKGHSAIDRAAFNGHELIVDYLIMHGADINTSNDNLETPLTIAIGCGHKKVAKLLIEKGANIFLGSKTFTPLTLAADKGFVEIIQSLIDRGVDVNREDADRRTALMRAVIGGHERVILLLLEHGSNINAADENGRTPLIFAAWEGHESIILLLLEHGSKINAADENGRTPLMYAAWGGHEHVCLRLLENGAEINIVDKGGDTALYFALWKNRERTARVLIEKGVNVNEAWPHGAAPLAVAAERGFMNIVQMCVKRGADIDRMNNGHTALYYAMKNKREEVADYLIRHGASTQGANAEELERKILKRDNGDYTRIDFSQKPHLLPGYPHTDMYSKLIDALKNEKYFYADCITQDILRKCLGLSENTYPIVSKTLRRIPYYDLLTIERLWCQFSRGEYGFSVQYSIYVKEDCSFDLFFKRVGWTGNKKNKKSNAPRGYYPKWMYNYPEGFILEEKPPEIKTIKSVLERDTNPERVSFSTDEEWYEWNQSRLSGEDWLYDESKKKWYREEYKYVHDYGDNIDDSHGMLELFRLLEKYSLTDTEKILYSRLPDLSS